jgi:hypothetical protein
MRTLRAFVAKSFHADDDAKVALILDLLHSFRPLGLVWESAERAEIESVSKKVRQKIDECDVFVCIFTRRHPIFTGKDSIPNEWTGPPWLFQESGYALKAGKKLLLIREAGVELPALQGDLEYIVYDPAQPQLAWRNAHQVLTQLIAQNVGITVNQLVSGPEPQTTGQEQAAESAAEGAAVELLSQSKKGVIERCFEDFHTAVEAKDFEDADRIQEEGARRIQAGETDSMTLGGLRCAWRYALGPATLGLSNGCTIFRPSIQSIRHLFWHWQKSHGISENTNLRETYP